MNQTGHWQLFTQHFPCISTMVRQGKLPDNYQPQDVIVLYHEGGVSSDELRVLHFLLHVWNRYEFPFELSEMMTWDSRHRKALIDWVSGRTLGTPCRYF